MTPEAVKHLKRIRGRLRRLAFGRPSRLRYWQIIADSVREYQAIEKAWRAETVTLPNKEKYIATDHELWAVLNTDQDRALLSSCWKAVEYCVNDGLKVIGRRQLACEFGTFDAVTGQCVKLPPDEPNLIAEGGE